MNSESKSDDGRVHSLPLPLPLPTSSEDTKKIGVALVGAMKESKIDPQRGNSEKKLPPEPAPKPSKEMRPNSSQEIVKRPKSPSLPPPQPPVTNWSDSLYECVQVSARHNLSEIVGNANDILPIRLTFCDSLYGVCDSFTCLKDEVFDIHFMKETTTANVLVHRSGTKAQEKFKIPLYADFKFSVCHDSPCDVEYTTSQLMKANPLPLTAVVKTGCKKSKQSPASEIKAGEILLILNRSHKSKVIECYSLLKKADKVIHKSADMVFIINPSNLMLRFIDLQHFHHSCFPIEAQIVTSLKKVQQNFAALKCQIGSLTKDKSLIASFGNSEHLFGGTPGLVKIYEIFLDVELDFQMVRMAELEKNNLYEKTNFLYHAFNPTSIAKTILNTGKRMQKEIFASMEPVSDWKTCTTLIKPNGLKSKRYESVVFDGIVNPNHHKDENPQLPPGSVPPISGYNSNSPNNVYEEYINENKTTTETIKIGSNKQHSLKLDDLSEDDVRLKIKIKVR